MILVRLPYNFQIILVLFDNLDQLEQHPEMYAKFQNEIRKGNVKGFPYSFYYQNDMPEELINILGIFAQAKDPKSIRKTLTSQIKNLMKS